jgi:diaminopimelate decarboxylase
VTKIPTTTSFCGHSIEALVDTHGTPVWVYAEEIIHNQCDKLSAFPVVRYAQKACSNIAILSLLRKRGVVVDAVTAGEVLRAQAAGYDLRPSRGNSPHQVVFTADVIDRDAAEVIREFSLPVNVGSTDMIAQVAEISPESPLILRTNPGFGHGHSQKVNTGGVLSKHGIWHEDLPEAVQLADKKGLHIDGVHMHIGSGADIAHLQKVAEAMVHSTEKLQRPLCTVSAGGGLSIPYREEQTELDLTEYLKVWNTAISVISKRQGSLVRLELEPGRFVVAQSCILLAEIRAIKRNQDTLFYLIDAGFDTLIRPAMYGAYHRISICHRTPPADTELRPVVVAGPLCESCDVFTQEEGGIVTTRLLPPASVGDIVVVHEAGAYGAVMSSNYNSRRLAPEVLLHGSTANIIRERQPYDMLFALERIPTTLR